MMTLPYLIFSVAETMMNDSKNHAGIWITLDNCLAKVFFIGFTAQVLKVCRTPGPTAY